MPLESLLKGIEKEAQQKADEILSDARKEADEIIEKAKKESKEQAELLIKNEQTISEREAMKKVSQARLEARKEILRHKQNILDSVFNEAHQELKELKDERYLNWMGKTIVESCEDGKEEIELSAKDEKLLPNGWLNSINGTLEKKGLKGNLMLKAVDLDFNGGFVMKNSKYEIVFTFNEILNSIKESKKAEVIKMLFGDSK